MGQKREKANYLIQSVSHALDVLEELAKSSGEIGVTQLSRILKLHKNNVFRLLATLELRGYARQNLDTEDYALGAKVLQLGQAYLGQSKLVARAAPIIKHLSEVTGETVSLAVLQNNEVQFPLSVEAKKPVKVTGRLAASLVARTCSVGKLLLAHLPESVLSEILAASGAQDNNSSFKAQVSELKNSGMVIDKGITDADVVTLGKVVKGLNNTVVGAIEVAAPMYRARLENLTPALESAANALSSSLGFGGISGSTISSSVEREIGSNSENIARK